MSGTPSGQEGSPTRWRSSSRSPTCCSSAGWTTSRPGREPGQPHAQADREPDLHGGHQPALEEVQASRPDDMFTTVVSSRCSPGYAASAAKAPRIRITCGTPASPSPRPPARKVVDMLDDIPMGERDTKGDLYEYMLSKIATAGQNGQFRTPRHIIQLIVEMMAPGRKTKSATRRAARRASSSPAQQYVRREHPRLCWTRAAASTSTTACSTASTSTTPCCASAA